jgi:hypothetical protein
MRKMIVGALALGVVFAGGCNAATAEQTPKAERAHNAQAAAEAEQAGLGEVKAGLDEASKERSQAALDQIEAKVQEVGDDPADNVMLDAEGMNAIDDTSRMHMLGIQMLRYQADHGEAATIAFNKDAIDAEMGEKATAPTKSLQSYYLDEGYSASWNEIMAYGMLLQEEQQ